MQLKIVRKKDEKEVIWYKSEGKKGGRERKFSEMFFYKDGVCV